MRGDRRACLRRWLWWWSLGRYQAIAAEAPVTTWQELLRAGRTTRLEAMQAAHLYGHRIGRWVRHDSKPGEASYRPGAYTYVARCRRRGCGTYLREWSGHDGLANTPIAAGPVFACGRRPFEDAPYRYTAHGSRLPDRE